MSTRKSGNGIRIAMIGLRGIPASYGGVEAAVEALSSQLVSRGHDVTVYARTSYSASRPASHAGVTIRYLPQVDTKHLEAASHTFLSVLDAMRPGRYDLIHLHATGPALFSVLPRLARRPCVATVHGLDWQREKWGPVASIALRLGARTAATVPNQTIVVSQRLRAEFHARWAAQAHYIPNGVNPSDFDIVEPVRGLTAGRFALFLGRLVPEKGVHTLIEAFSRTDVDCQLAIAGPSSHSDRYVEELHRLAKADPRIVFLGARFGAEKNWLLRQSAAFVQPSTLEGLPLTLLEALVCGAHPVLSDIAEHREVLSPLCDAATFFRVGDSVELAAKLQTVLRAGTTPSHGDRLADLVVERYDWGRIAIETESVYLKALAERRSQ